MQDPPRRASPRDFRTLNTKEQIAIVCEVLAISHLLRSGQVDPQAIQHTVDRLVSHARPQAVKLLTQ